MPSSITSSQPIRIAQIGVGYWGPNLLRNLVTSSACQVTLVVDASEERRRYVQELYPELQIASNVECAFENSKIQAVVIATPAKTHFALAMAALQADKHVLIEKPMATSVEEVDQIAELASKKSLVAMAGHTFLFNPAVRYLKKLIDSGELGEIRYIYSQRLNLGRIRSDVDALWNLAPHDVSIIQFLLDNAVPTKIRRIGMDFIQQDIDDVVFLMIEYSNKLMAHVHVSWLDPHKVRCMTIVGSKKMAVYDDVAENKVTIYDKGIDEEMPARLGDSMDYDKGSPPFFTHRAGDILIPKINWKEPLQEEIAHFISCIRGKEKCITGPMHARKVVEILSTASAIT